MSEQALVQAAQARAVAEAMHRRIVRNIQRVWTSKISVYLLLSDFKRRKLYRLLRAPGTGNCAPRRFSTWQDYLADLGGAGISFGYFAELERLERRYGREIVRLCAGSRSGRGLHVVTRRQLLKAWKRTFDEVKDVLRSDLDDAEKIKRIEQAAELWQSEHNQIYPTTPTPHRRISVYRRCVARWEEKLAQAADDAARVPPDFRRGPVFTLLPLAWREVFERHLEIGERLAEAGLSPQLSARHARLIREFRAVWYRRPEAGRAETGRPETARPEAGRTEAA